MDTARLLDELRKERDELSATINVLERRLGAGTVSGSKPKKHGRPMSGADRARMSAKLKAVWRAKRAQAEARSRAAKKAAAVRKTPKMAKAA